MPSSYRVSSKVCFCCRAEKAVGVVVSAGVNVAAKAATTVASKAIDNMADRGKSSSSAGRKAM